MSAIPEVHSVLEKTSPICLPSGDGSALSQLHSHCEPAAAGLICEPGRTQPLVRAQSGLRSRFIVEVGSEFSKVIVASECSLRIQWIARMRV